MTISEISTLLDQFATQALKRFSTASLDERNRICEDLEAMAAYEGLDLKTALRGWHPELLTRVLHHQELQRQHPEA